VQCIRDASRRDGRDNESEIEMRMRKGEEEVENI
jgi:hypothetical protein